MGVLISTYWNVNRVNTYEADVDFGFNLNLLECKRCMCLCRLDVFIVLISTYWNVNIGIKTEFIKNFKVLISTYWNVNYEYGNLRLLQQIRFNLNLLECKPDMQISAVQTSAVLISTYWNVN